VLRLARARRRPAVSPEEWTLLALVDGRRTVADLVGCRARGEYAVVTALAGLVGAACSSPTPATTGCCAATSCCRPLEGVVVEAARRAVPLPARRAAPPVAAPPPSPRRRPQRTRRSSRSVPSRSPGASSRPPGAGARHRPRADGRQQRHVHQRARLGQRRHRDAAGRGPRASGLVERDPNVNKSLLLRLIAGVRGL
jgi:hypothetical protein